MNKIRIYGAEYCPFCHKAKDLAQARGVEFEYIDINEDGPEHKAFLKAEGHRTIPQIYEWDDEKYQFKRHIGGYEDFLRYLN